MTLIPADSTTTATIGLNDNVDGEIEIVGDRDWFRFEAGVDGYVDVTLSGTGFTGLNDTYLRVYDENGNLLEENDDTGSDLSSALTFFAEEDMIYFISAAGYEGGNQTETGNYTLTTSASLPPSPLDSIRWGVQRDSSVISYYFAPDGVTAAGADGFVSDGFNAYEEQQFVAAFDAISAVADVSFVEVDDIDDADFVLILDDDEINQLPRNDQFAGFFTVSSSSQAVGVFNADSESWSGAPGGPLEKGGDGYQTIMHEILHGMGLAHPHDDGGTSDILNGVSSPFFDYGDFDLNQGVFTAMSYNTGYRTGDDTSPDGTDYGYDAGPMALDIALLQELYGANTTTATGDDAYLLPSENDTGTAWKSIWDTGGVDTMFYEGSRSVTIDLRPATLAYGVGGGGFVSHAEGIQGGWTIAHGVVIEDAIGDNGNDQLIGNTVGNALYGNNGRDTLSGGFGEDLLNGGSGADSLFGGAGADELIGGNGADDLFGQSGGDVLSAESGLNTLNGGSGFDEIIGGTGIDQAYGGSGDDLIRTNNGSDLLFGGRGRDTMEGGANNDKLTGGLGADTLSGGSGSDQFIFDFVAESRVGTEFRDTITDFGTGDRIVLSNIDADLGTDGDQAFVFIDTAGFTATAGEIRVQAISGNDVVVEIDQNADGIADMEILVLGGVELDGNDFIL